MNKVIMIGRLTKEVALNTTGAKPVGKFTIAVNRDFKNKDGKYDADFINCVAFDKRAEVIAKHFSKGSQIALTGSWRTGSFDGKDGNKVYTNELFVDSFEFIGQATGNTNKGSNEVDNSNISNDTSFEEPVDDGSLPF
mgnify:FL=1